MVYAPSEVHRHGLRALVRARLRRTLERSLLRKHVFWRVPATRPGIALTFDDGPHPEYTPRILDALQAGGALATFFLIGEAACRHPDIVRRIVREGHAIGSHTYHHADLSRLGWRDAWRECRMSQDVLQGIAQCPVRLLRPPWGRTRGSTLPIAIAGQMALAFWSVDSLDHRHLEPAEILTVVEQANPIAGDILLFHDDGANTVHALPHILAYFRKRGHDCLSLPSFF